MKKTNWQHLKALSNIDSILFDLDGTLVDSPIDFKQMRNELGIKPSKDILTYLDELAQIGEDERYAEASKIIFEIEKKAAKKSTVFEGVKDFLKFLFDSNVKMGIITRNNREMTKIQTKEISHFFLDMLTRDEVKKVKPSPESFEYYKNKYQFNNQRTLFIGNHDHDRLFAENCGLAYLQYSPFKSEEACLEYEFNDYGILKEFFSKLDSIKLNITETR